VQKLTHHRLRDFFATIAIESGVDIPTVAVDWLGHSKRDGGALLLRRYRKSREEHSRAMASKVTFGPATNANMICPPMNDTPQPDPKSGELADASFGWKDLESFGWSPQPLSAIMHGFSPEAAETLLLWNDLPESETGPHIPGWVRRAAQRAVKDIMPPPNSTEFFELGWISGLGSELLASVRQIEDSRIRPVVDILEKLIDTLPKAVAQRPIELVTEFCDGVRQGKDRATHLDALPHKPKCLFVLWLGWRHFQAMSMAQVHRQFVEWKLVSENTDPRLTRAFLSTIGFPVGRAGRPKSKNPE
jgi:hypothetical protein